MTSENKNVESSYEANKKIRKDWGDVRPYVRVFKDRRREEPKERKEKEIKDHDYED